MDKVIVITIHHNKVIFLLEGERLNKRKINQLYLMRACLFREIFYSCA